MNKSILAIAVASLLPATSSLAQEAAADETMVVTANRFEQPVGSVLAPVSIITRKDIEQLQPQSIYDVLKTIPGIEGSFNGTKANSSAIYIRGTSSRHALVLVDGVRINSSTLGGASIGLIPVQAIERVEVIRGPRASVYGSDAIGGVISITTTPVDGSVHKASLDFGSNQYNQQTWRSAGDVSANTRGSIFVGNEQSSGYRVSTSAPESDEHGFDNQTVLGSLNHQLTEDWATFFTGFYQQGTTEYNGYSLTKYESDSEKYTFAGGASYDSDLVGSHLTLSSLKDWSADGVADGGSSGKGSLTTKRNSVSWLNTYKGLQDSLINVGVDYYEEKATRGGTNSTDFAKNRKTNGAVFVTTFSQLTERLSMEASVRSDDDSAFGNHTTWNIGGGYHVTDRVQLTAAYGTAFKAPTFNDLYYPGGLGNPDLKPETSESAELGIKGYSNLIDWSLNAYHTEIEDMIDWAPEYEGGPWRPSNVDSAKIQGLELELVFDTGPVNHHVVADWKDPKDAQTNEQLIRRAKENYKWVVNYSLDSVHFAMTANYVGKRYDSNQYELKAFTTMDAAIKFDVTDNWSAGLRVSNLTDEEYETAQGYISPEREWYFNTSYQF